ncbi:tetratricopeptide repeat protein, partial [Acinetobacter baumannii]
ESRKGALDRAADLLGKAVAAAPDALRPRMLLAQTQLRLGDAHQSLRPLQPLPTRDPARAAALVLAAAAASRGGDAAKAEQLL